MNDYHYIESEKQFQEIRKTKIGASDIPVLFGLVEQTPWELYRTKKGLDPPWDGNTATDIGHMMEPGILWLCLQRGTKENFIRKYYQFMFEPSSQHQTRANHIFFTEAFHKDFPFLMAHADCLVLADKKQKPYGIQAKSGSRFANIRRDGFDGYEIEDESENGIPLKVYLQVQAEMMVYDIDTWIVASIIDTNEYNQWTIRADKEVHEKIIMVSESFNWCLVNDREPPPRKQSRY